jgi:hypothetical protein
MTSPGNTAGPSKPLDLAPVVAQIAERMGMEEMLSYGVPREFWETFNPPQSMQIEAYSDSIVGAERASPCALVVCVDYLHQVGMLRIADVLDDLKRVTRGIGFFQVTTEHDVEGIRTIHQPLLWWLAEFGKRFNLQTYQRIPGGFYVIVYPKGH